MHGAVFRGDSGPATPVQAGAHSRVSVWTHKEPRVRDTARVNTGYSLVWHDGSAQVNILKVIFYNEEEIY